jgi:peptidoglycan/LPS O-acetylase OafA/YrhL
MGFGYRPEIDGLRAFAVIPVILFHMGLSWLPGGYIGVDVFFVISGFLITSIIKKELEQGTFSFGDFWARRVRRIVPAMIVVTSTTLAVTYAFVFGPDQQAIGKQGLVALLSVANIYFWRITGDYWGAAAEESPFLHAWSLSVEEQFYLFFPVVTWLIFRFQSLRLQICILTAVISSLALFLWGLQAYPIATFYLLPTRVWELGTGCLLAVSLSNQTPKYANSGIFAIAGLGMVFVSYLFIDKPNGGLGLAVVGAALIIAFGGTGLCNKLLSQRAIVNIGKISYSLYLWHWPVLILGSHLGLGGPAVVDKVVLLFATYLLAFATYHLVEKPTRQRKGIIPVIVGCSFVAIGASAFLAYRTVRYDTSDYATPHWYGLYFDLKPGNELNEDFERIVETMDVPKREVSRDAYKKGGIIVGQGDSSPRVVVLGDSHGVMWSNAIRTVTEKLKVKTSFISMNAESPFISLPLSGKQGGNYLSPEEKFAYDKSRMDLIKEWKPDLVILCCRWSGANEAITEDLLGFLEKHSRRVLLMEQPPELQGIGNHNALQYFVYRGIRPESGVRRYFPQGNISHVEEGRNLVRVLAAKHHNCGYIAVHDLYTKESNALILDGANVLFVDDDHLTTYGAQIAGPRIEQSITEAIQNHPKDLTQN